MPGPIDRKNVVHSQPTPQPTTEVITPKDVAEITVKQDTEQKVKNPRVAELYKQLQTEKEALEKELQPYREVHDKHVNDPKFLEARKKIKEINAKLGPICNELASIARAGGARSIKVESGSFATTPDSNS